MKQQYLDAGQIVSTHGIRGEVKVLPWADGPEFLTLFDRVYLKGREYVLESARVQKTCVLLKLQGVDTVEAAQTLRDTVVQVDREDVELEEGTYFIADLIGLRVLEGEREIGVIREILTMPGNDVYVVQGEHTYMIPAVKEFLLDKGGNVTRAKLVKLEPKKDEKTGRMMMTEIPGTEYTVQADLVLIAAGFLGSEEYVTKAFGVEVNARTNVATPAGEYHTNVERVFTAGDMHRGQSLVVWAIREGREAAKAVDESLMGYSYL